ncbi:CocE/NonD family hydrolase [Sphingobium sp. 3R8]|uniref:CocE/NonD family hydrolase n=1 Tax=Sphingobium sp. 3R8 TaxID=2874921 RepID=UPI001CCF66AF|nr:CocE/NonD family hydrolase [Sphingobium sp. 3R8]MBZ9646316.1 CocE/NonD family hydrolase [Sphingobium sp. 3R8]
MTKQASIDRLERAMAVTVEADMPVPMRDGTILRADVYTPEGPGPWPVLLSRTPYGRAAPDHLMVLEPVRAAQKGFIIVHQDTRSRGGSEGEWMPFRHEYDDGHDSVEWAARLPKANGRVGMFGGSYVGNTQWMAAAAQPPSLGAISPMVTWCDPMDGLYGRGGAIEWGVELPWTMQMGFEYIVKHPTLPPEEKARLGGELLADVDGMKDRGYWDLPVRRSPTLEKYKLPGLGAIRAIDEPETVAWCRVAGQHDRIDVPSLHWGGWYDIFLQGTLDNYVAMAAAGKDARLLVGPWTHGIFRDPIGDLCFGAMASRLYAPVHPHGDTNDFQLAWFRRHLTPDAEVALPDTPVRIFVMGRNEWRDEPAWPLERARTEQHFLRSGGGLTTGKPDAAEDVSTFTYDPADPVPTLGGPLVMAAAYPAGPLDQAPVEARDDVLIFTSAPLTEEVEVTGRIRVVLHAASSAPSTDWVARLCDVHPDGRSIILADGITRVVTGADAIDRHEIDLWSTSNVFLPGHCIRVQVTSSCFPRWDRNLNTGDQDGTAMRVAQQRIFHDADRPSFIELPVVPVSGEMSA